MARRQTSAPNPHTPTGRVAPLPLVETLAQVRARWAADALHNELTLARMGDTAVRFTARLEAEGVNSWVDVGSEHAAGFVFAVVAGGAAPEIATAHARRTALRAVFRTLRAMGHTVGDPTLDVVLPPRGLTAARPLTDDEVMLCRASSQMVGGHRTQLRTTAWALGEATAITSEITAVRIADLDDPADPHTVDLPGTSRTRARVVPLTPWGAMVVATRTQELRALGADSSTLLAYGGAAPAGGATAQASVCNAVREVLIRTGLGHETDVRPASLRNWAGRTAYDGGASIEAVARLLGHRSLDGAAQDIALDWSVPDAREASL